MEEDNAQTRGDRILAPETSMSCHGACPRQSLFISLLPSATRAAPKTSHMEVRKMSSIGSTMKMCLENGRGTHMTYSPAWLASQVRIQDLGAIGRQKIKDRLGQGMGGQSFKG